MQAQTTAERIQDLEQAYCEYHKDVHGVKARWIKFTSVEEGEAAMDALEATGKVIWAQEEEDRKAAAVRFEARVAETIATGAKDRETAMRWIHDAEGTQGDDEFLCYCLGLRYGYFKVAQTAA